MIRWLKPGSFRKKSLSLEYVSLSLSSRICKPVPVLFLESVRATSENRFCPRPMVPDEAASARMMQPEDTATCALLALQFRARTVIEGLIIRSR